MNKQNLLRFIQKYSLGGLIESVAWNAEGNKLMVRFISDDKTLLGEVEYKAFTSNAMNVGIYTTSLLKSMIGILDNDIALKVDKAGDKSVSLKLSSDETETSYQLADLGVIPPVPDLKALPEFGITIDMAPTMIDKFIKAKGALSDIDTFTVFTEGGDLKMAIGYSSISTNRVTFTCQKSFDGDVKPISFSAKYLKEILTANKEATSAKLKVSIEGLSHVEFQIDDFVCKYYLVEISN
ncbi:hypothetical protein UFOVP449_148 [uncultured Caudovirales phage]|uniref:Uncharacterized protein n=1 Tax=uncultured Caudovirales phage TaxID=2100421 RepID=A0A6J5MDZ9_9CAUD|nr:hypothetical protein UFOVP449_148 [uncultured Caudovirales phage]